MEHMGEGHWWGMGAGHGLWMVLGWIVVILVIAALIKYLFK